MNTRINKHWYPLRLRPKGRDHEYLDVLKEYLRSKTEQEPRPSEILRFALRITAKVILAGLIETIQD